MKEKKLHYKLKRTFALSLASVFAAGALAACTPIGSDTTPAPSPENSSVPAPTQSVTAAPSEVPSEAPPEAPTPTPEPTPEPLAPAFRDIELPIEVKYDYFAIPEEVLALMTEGDRELYRRVALAFFNYENTVEIPEGMEDHPNLWRVIDMYFPLFFADVSDESIAEDGGVIRWEYKSTAEAHEKTIADFESRIDELLCEVVESDSFIMQVLTVYKTFTSSIEYDGTNINGEEQHGPSDIPYIYRHAVNAIMDKKGVCWCFARAYNFLLCQIGAQSLTVHGLRKGDSAIHEWTVFKYKDEWRYADPTWDIGGNSLYFFGFTIKTREHDGYPEKDVSVLEGKTYRASEYFDVSGKFFSALYNGYCSGNRYELDHENGLIVFYEVTFDLYGETVEIKLCTYDPENAKYEFFD